MRTQNSTGWIQTKSQVGVLCLNDGQVDQSLREQNPESDNNSTQEIRTHVAEQGQQ